MQKLIRFSIDHLTAVVAMMLIIFLFGLVALRSVPIQMSPDIEKPIMQVRVAWPGASPSDIKAKNSQFLDVYNDPHFAVAAAIFTDLSNTRNPCQLI